MDKVLLVRTAKTATAHKLEDLRKIYSRDVSVNARVGWRNRIPRHRRVWKNRNK